MPVLSVFSEHYNSPDIVNPDLITGTNLTIDVLASNLPSVTDQNSGGLEGFDLSLSFNSSVLKADRISFAAPLCPASDGCIFDVPLNETLTYASSVSSPSGTARLAMIVLAQNLRAGPLTSQVIPTILFRASFLVVGQGRSPITIQSSVSQLIGYAEGFCQPLSGFTVENGSFDNRPPFFLSVSKSSITIVAGKTGSVTVAVNATRPGENVNATLLLSGIIPEYHTDYVFNPRTMLLSSSSSSFSSTLSIATTSSSQLGTHPLEIVGAVPFADQHFSYRLPFNLTITSTLSMAALTPNQVSPSLHTISVAPPSSPSTISPVLATFAFSNIPTVGAPVSFLATIWCGTAPYTYTWNFGDGTTSTGISTTHTFATSGPYPVTLTVTDTDGKSFTAQQTVDVGGSTPTSGLDSPTVLGGLLSILILLLMGVLVVRRRRRKR
jgi:PKD domain